MPDAAVGLLSLAEAGPLTQLQRAPGRSVCARRSRSPCCRGGRCAAAAAHGGRSSSSRSIRGWPAGPIWRRCLAAMFAGRWRWGVREVAEAARCQPPCASPRARADLLLEGSGGAIHRRVRRRDRWCVERSMPSRKRDSLLEEALRWLWLACRAARTCCGTSKPGMRSPLASSGSPARPARSPCSLWP